MPRILIVDDDPVVRHLLSAILSACGYFALASASGAEALQLLGSDSFDLILLDVQLAASGPGKAPVAETPRRTVGNWASDQGSLL